MKAKKNRLLPLPISAYLIGFFAISAVLFTAVGGWMLWQMDRVTTIAEESRQRSADNEVKESIQRVLDTTTQTLDELAHWDESHQQLRDATYYEYWRETRIAAGARLAHFITDVDLYDKQGKVLVAIEDSALPAQLPSQGSFVRMEQGKAYLYQYSLIPKKDNAVAIIGYVGLRLDLLHALRDLNRFIHADSESFRLEMQEGEQIDTPLLLQRLHYSPYHFGSTTDLEALMVSTLSSFAILALALIIVSYFLTSSLLHAPLRRLSQYIEALRRGKGDVRDDTMHRELCVSEFEVLRSSIINYQHELEEMHSHLDQKNKELWRLAHHDVLTGIANRRAYEEDWQRLLELVRGQRIDIAVMLIDCDHFKAINDTYGHDTGDQVIRLIAEVLSTHLREGDHLYRLGGDEFAVHLLNSAHDDARILAQRFQQALQESDFKGLGIKEPVRFSIGIATANGQEPKLLTRLHRHADIAMYQAKRPGVGKVVAYHAGMATEGEALISNRYISAVYHAIEKGVGFELHFQPVLGSDPRDPGFYEVLCRLRDERGIIMPINIFPVVQSEGLAVEFDYAMITEMARLLRQETIPADSAVSINIDGSTLMHDDFVKQVVRLKPYIGKNCRKIILEITENALISEIEEGSRKLERLRQEGFTIALDDFGSGYSSLRYLANMPVDLIKFDIGMVRDLEGEPRQRIITQHVARMVREAGYQLVAEGIETETQLQHVLNLGFTHVQGFFCGRPQPSIAPAQTLIIDTVDEANVGALHSISS